MIVGWENVQLKQIVDSVIGGDWGKAPDHDEPEYIDVLCIRGTELRNWHNERGLSAAPRRIKKGSLVKRRLDVGDIVLEVSGGGPDQPVGRVELIDKQALAHNSSLPRICTNFFRRVVLVEEVDPAYVVHFLKYFYATGAIRDYQAGSNNLRNLIYTKYETIRVPLPPLNEQQRIVEKIETLFAQLDKGEEAVREVQKLLTRYRQSVLKAAVTGQLTKSDRSGWEAVELGSLLDDLRYGTAQKCGYEVASTAVLRIPNVAGGEISITNLKYTDLPERDAAKLALELGDILVVRSNGSANLVGRGAVVSEAAVGMAFAGYLIRMRVNRDRVLPEYVHLSMSAPQTRSLIERQARSTSGVHNINSGEINAIAIELPSIPEQVEIIAAVEDALSKIAVLDVWCATELKRSASLRQSILKEAFAGRLVPQDPTDEPASALLARIAAEKTTAKKPRRKTTA